MDYTEAVEKALREAELRVAKDYRNERLQKKIRDAEIEKIPYMVIIGEKERDSGLLSIRSKAQGDIGKMDMNGFTAMLKKEIQEKVR